MKLFRFRRFSTVSNSPAARSSTPTSSSPTWGLFEDLIEPLHWNLPPQSGVFRTRADFKEGEKDYQIDASIPGIPKDQVKIEHFGQQLKISGSVKKEEEKKEEKYFVKELF